MLILPFRPAERSALLASCLSAARMQSVGKMAFKKDAVRCRSEQERVLPFRPAERSALLTACLSEARTQSVGKLVFKKDAVRWQDGFQEGRSTSFGLALPTQSLVLLLS